MTGPAWWERPLWAVDWEAWERATLEVADLDPSSCDRLNILMDLVIEEQRARPRLPPPPPPDWSRR